MRTGPIQNQPLGSSSVTHSSEKGSVAPSSGGRLKEVQPNIIARAIGWVKAHWNVGSTRKELLELYRELATKTDSELPDNESEALEDHGLFESWDHESLFQDALKKFSPNQAKTILDWAKSIEKPDELAFLFKTITNPQHAQFVLAIGSNCDPSTLVVVMELLNDRKDLSPESIKLKPDQTKTFLRLAALANQTGNQEQVYELVDTIFSNSEARQALTHASKFSDAQLLHLFVKGNFSDFASINRIFKKVKDPSAYGVLADLFTASVGTRNMKSLEIKLTENPARMQNILSLLRSVHETVNKNFPSEQLAIIAEEFFKLDSVTLEKFNNKIVLEVASDLKEPNAVHLMKMLRYATQLTDIYPKITPEQAKIFIRLAAATDQQLGPTEADPWITKSFKLPFEQFKLLLSVASDLDQPTLVDLIEPLNDLNNTLTQLPPNQAETFLRLAAKVRQQGDYGASYDYDKWLDRMQTALTQPSKFSDTPKLHFFHYDEWCNRIQTVLQDPEAKTFLTHASKFSDAQLLHLFDKGTASDFASIDRIFKQVKDPSAYGVLEDLLAAAAGTPNMKSLEGNLLANPKRTNNILELLGYIQQTTKGKVPPEQLGEIASVFFTLNNVTLQKFDQFIQAALALRNIHPDKIAEDDPKYLKSMYSAVNMALADAAADSSSANSPGWSMIRSIFTDALFRSIGGGTVLEDVFAIQSPTAEGLEVQKARATFAPKSNALETCALRTQLLLPKTDSSGNAVLRFALSEKQGGIRVVEVPLPGDFNGDFRALVEATKKEDLSNPIIRMSDQRLREANFSLDHPPSHADSVEENVIYTLPDGKLALLPQASPNDPAYTIQSLAIPKRVLLNNDGNVATVSTPQGSNIENGVQFTFNYTDKELNLTLTKSGVEHKFALTRRVKGMSGVVENESNRALLERFVNEELEQQLLVLQSKILTKDK